MDQAMSCDGVLAGKDLGHDAQVEMTALPGAGVAGMAGRVIFDDQRQGLQDGQPVADQGDAVFVQAGSAFLKGLTVTC